MAAGAGELVILDVSGDTLAEASPVRAMRGSTR